MFKKAALVLVSLMLLITAVAPAAVAGAAGANLIANASVETAAGTSPSGWATGKWGTNAATFTYKTTEGHTGSRSLYLSMTSRTSGDAKWYFTPTAVKPSTKYTYSEFYKANVATEIDIQYADASGKLSYAYLSSPAASATVWKQANAAFTTPATAKTLTIFHLINRVGALQTDDFSLTEGNGTVTPTPPSVSITAPLTGATASGIQTLSATATDAVGVAGVQFKVDGTNVGTEDTTAPYSVSLDTTKLANGSHTIAATARNTSNLTASTSITANVQNSITPPTSPNLIPNPSLETANGAAPQGWLSSSWGANTAAFSYLNTGHIGSHSIKAEISQYSSGAANWYYADIPVTAGKTYQYTNWYQSNVDTEVDAEVTMNDGSVQYYWLGNVLANTNWTKYTATFTAPAGAKSMAAYQLIAKAGYVVSDDYSLLEYTPPAFNRGIVSVTLDDGWASQYQNALPVLQKYGLPGTFYIISGELTDQPDYMTGTQVKNLQTAGNEIGSHSVTHPDLTTVSQTQLVSEMASSQSALQNLLGVPVTDFAYPYGAYNSNTISVGKQYYQSQRTVNAGYNSKDSFDLAQLKIEEVDSNISRAQVQAWIDGTIANKTWLILVYHEVAATPIAPGDDLYTTQPSDFDAEMAYLKNSGAATETVHQAINEVLPQL